MENHKSYQVPGCLANILPPFLSTCGINLGPWELLEKKNQNLMIPFLGISSKERYYLVGKLPKFEVPGCLGNTFPHFLSNCRSRLGPRELLKKR